MPDYACSTCGDTFTVPQQIVDRYDNWTPSTCMKCRDAKKTAKPASRPKRTKTKTARENLSLAEVLEAFTDGPDTGVFTDGSSVPNPGPGGWGSVYVIDGEIVAEANGHDPDTTNNRMELTALIEGAKLVPVGTPTTLHSDSNLAVQTINDWAKGWEAKGWKRKSGPIANLDLVQELYQIAKDRPELTFQWIRAHAGSRWNEYADALSTAWARDTR